MVPYNYHSTFSIFSVEVLHSISLNLIRIRILTSLIIQRYYFQILPMLCFLILKKNNNNNRFILVYVLPYNFHNCFEQENTRIYILVHIIISLSTRVPRAFGRTCVKRDSFIVSLQQ